jgi:hypothetical protein
MPPTIDAKDALPLAPLLGSILTYFGATRERLERARRIARTYGFGAIYAAANIWPHWIYIIAFVLIILSSFCYFAAKLFDSVIALPYVGASLQWILENYHIIFFAWLGFVFLAFLQAIEHLVLFVLSFFHRKRETVDWANARWPIREGNSNILAPSQAGLTNISNRIVGDLASAPPNRNLALRPPDLENDEAANVLYFGHIIEEYTTDTRGPRFPWTPFYEAMAKVAMSAGRPFSAKTLAGFDGMKHSFLSDVLLIMNGHVDPDCPPLMNDAVLEQRVSQALRILQQEFSSDARTIARGWFRSSYDTILTKSRSVLKLEEMRRQFAKLTMLWNVVDNLHRPDVFKVPFSGGIFVLYLNNEVLLTENDRFERKDPSVQICFECAQQRMMETVLDLIETCVDTGRAAWRDKERQTVASRGADWRTWVLYRADQHAYHLGRVAEQKPWMEINNRETFIKTKS